MKIFPFAALRPRKGLESKIASLPYDVMTTSEAAEMARGNPLSFLHVVRSEIDFPEGIDPHSDGVYEKADENLKKMISEGALVLEDAPNIYVYRQKMGSHEQTSVVACCEIDDYANNTILRHEKTRQDKEDDRTNHILKTSANTGQVFLTYRDAAVIDWIVAAICLAEPIYDFTAVDGIKHTVWKAENKNDVKALLDAFKSVPKAYIADGHHRSAASFRAGMERRNATGNNTDTEAEYNRFMACLFPASQLKILPYNRCIKDLNNLPLEKFIFQISKILKVEEVGSKNDIPEITSTCSCGMYIAGKWYKLAWILPDKSKLDPVSQLDVSRLQEDILSPVLGIGDPRTDERIFFVGGIRGNEELVRLVDSGEAAVAFSMFPTTIEQMMSIADAGQTMPPKSTWFEPKLRSGLLIHLLN